MPQKIVKSAMDLVNEADAAVRTLSVEEALVVDVPFLLKALSKGWLDRGPCQINSRWLREARNR